MHTLHTAGDLTSLLNDMGDRRIVMLGEASHGTHEYYAWRTAISQRLIKEKGFSFIAVEGDWPDCYKINRHIKSYGDTPLDIEEILKTFDRWPTWMWGNWEIAALAEWLRQHNRSFSMDKMVGFYGLDVYSLWESMTVMMNYLEKEDPIAARSVKKAIRCFEPYNQSEQLYARFTINDRGCSEEVLAMLKEIRAKAQFLDGDREAGFSAEQNALIAVNAERYYRSMMSFDNESWNIRDRHMMETLDRLMKFHGKNAKAIVWEHNTHIGDARATDMNRAGMVNIGQLAREEYGEEDVYLVGFASYGGTVIAGNEWGAPMKIMQMPDAKAGSIEADLHRKTGVDHYLLFSEEKDHSYQTEINHRAIGVVYNPAMERSGNYVPSVLSRRYDAFIYFDNTRALHPLHLHPDRHKLPATYPFNL